MEVKSLLKFPIRVECFMYIESESKDEKKYGTGFKMESVDSPEDMEKMFNQMRSAFVNTIKNLAEGKNCCNSH